MKIMSDNFKNFKDLHYGKNLFVLPNAWNPKSALLFQENGFAAIGTSSAAVSDSLGYQDGEGMPFDDYLFIIKRMVNTVNIPCTIDIEMGYGKTNQQIADNILQLIELGVAGINIEDSVFEYSNRLLKDASEFAKTLEHIKNFLDEKEFIRFLLNVRCDTYLLNVENKQKETNNRMAIYQNSGADGIFLPCISNENDISEAVSHTKLPVSVMCIPGLPDFELLQTIGVKRVSMGPFMFNKTYDKVLELSKKIIEEKIFAAIL
jgi:2-methylisocitrate lyase-like PEP mutase family enzyme